MVWDKGFVFTFFVCWLNRLGSALTVNKRSIELFKSETYENYVHCTRLGLTMIAYHIIHLPMEVRTRDLQVPGQTLYHRDTKPWLYKMMLYD